MKKNLTDANISTLSFILANPKRVIPKTSPCDQNVYIYQLEEIILYTHEYYKIPFQDFLMWKSKNITSIQEALGPY